MKTLKDEMKELERTYKQRKKELKAEAKERKRRDREWGKQSRRSISSFLEDITLDVCNHFDSLAKRIEYKRRDPDGYEADQVVEECEKIVKRLTNKKEKKGLSDKDKEILYTLNLNLMVIKEKNLGCRVEKTTELSKQISELMPGTSQFHKEMLEQIFSHALNSLPQPTEE